MNESGDGSIESNGSTDRDEFAERKAKLAGLRTAGNAYPNHFKPTNFAEYLHQQYAGFTKEQLAEKQVEVAVAGRMMLNRLMGKASFMQLQDQTGKIQIYLRQNDLPEGVFADYKTWDLGDVVGVVGRVFKTNTGELSVYASSVELLTKSLRPLPDKFHGLADQELCYRQRYLDLLVNEQSRSRFMLRSRLVNALRQFLTERRFIEVETPMMHQIAGGAAARPFNTHHNALDMPLFLRIAPELFLKRLVVGGFDRVFEVNRNFRNEGLSTRHNPEFTMVEFYQAYADFTDMMDLTEAMMRYLADQLLGSQQLTYQGQSIDLSKSFQRMTLLESILQFNPDLKSADIDSIERAKATAEKLGVMVMPHYGLGKIQLEIFEKTVEERLLDPTFITHYPLEVSPLARRNEQDPTLADRFEFFVAGRELANGFSELNDPEDQASRFEAQVKDKQAGDGEAMPYDAEYIKALEHGLPPTAGEGIGIDRLVMLFTDAASIRDVILFPLMRQKAD